MSAASGTPSSPNLRSGRKTPHGVLEVDWPFFGEMCRALALKIFREYDPDVVIGIARAGVIPGAVVASILQRDYPLIMGTYLLYAFLICIANLVVDLTYGVLDPRIKVGK